MRLDIAAGTAVRLNQTTTEVQLIAIGGLRRILRVQPAGYGGSLNGTKNPHGRLCGNVWPTTGDKLRLADTDY
jgi:hypothetical protein